MSAESAGLNAGDLSIVIVTYNSRGYIEACLESLSDVDAEIFVVDNASRDGTVEVVRSRFPTVNVIEPGVNVGFSAANNRALESCSGRFLLLLNPDTEVPQNGLAAAVRAMEDRPEIGMLGCRLVRRDGTLDHACKRGFPTPASALAYFVGAARWPISTARLRRVARAYTAEDVGEHEEAQVDAVNGAFMLVRRSAFERVGFLDERFWMYGEDLDWCYRFREAGWPVLYWPGITVIHHKGASSGTMRSWRVNHAFHACMWLFYRKHLASASPKVVVFVVWAAIWSKLFLSAARVWVASSVASRGAC